jgi:hypothetical protein
MTMMIVFFSIILGMISIVAIAAALFSGDYHYGIIGAVLVGVTIISLFFAGASLDNEKAKERIAAYNQLGIEAVNADDYTGNQLKEMYKVETFSGTYYFDIKDKD